MPRELGSASWESHRRPCRSRFWSFRLGAYGFAFFAVPVARKSFGLGCLIDFD